MNDRVERPVVYGRNAVTELLQSDSSIDTLFLSDTLDAKTKQRFTQKAKEAGAVVKLIPQNKLHALCQGERHQGVAAYAAEVSYSSLQDILDAAASKNQPPFILLCDGIEDPHNLGALLRSALLCGAHGAVIPKRGAASVSPVVMKSSAGAAAVLPIARVTNLGEAIRTLKKANVFVYCADMDGMPMEKQDLSGPFALVLGNEGKGVSPLIKKLCDGSMYLSMASAGSVDSFNVSVAGGIFMYEVFRKRQV